VYPYIVGGNSYEEGVSVEIGMNVNFYFNFKRKTEWRFIFEMINVILVFVRVIV